MKLATSCYLEKDNKTLMLHRIKRENDIHKDKWVGLGGKIEPGESPEECIIREVKEESGLTLKNPILKGILTFPGFNADEDWYVFLYTAHDFTGELVEGDEGVLEWIDNSEIFNLNILEGDKLFLDWMKKYNFFSGKLIYKDGKFVEHELTAYS